METLQKNRTFEVGHLIGPSGATMKVGLDWDRDMARYSDFLIKISYSYYMNNGVRDNDITDYTVLDLVT